MVARAAVAEMVVQPIAQVEKLPLVLVALVLMVLAAVVAVATDIQEAWLVLEVLAVDKGLTQQLVEPEL